MDNIYLWSKKMVNTTNEETKCPYQLDSIQLPKRNMTVCAGKWNKALMDQRKPRKEDAPWKVVCSSLRKAKRR